MKKFAYIENGQIKEVGGLPTNWQNTSNFFALEDDLETLKQYNWLPIETISENKEITVSTEYIIEENLVKEIITTRDKTQEEIEKDNQNQLEAKWQSVRFKRNNLLKDSDVEVISDKWEEMSSQIKSLWSNYRKELRNIPQTQSNPDEIIWPEKP